MPIETGFVFHCCSCKSNLTVFKFLLHAHGNQRAQEYAGRRVNSVEVVGIVRYPKVSRSAFWTPKRSVVKHTVMLSMKGKHLTIKKNTDPVLTESVRSSLRPVLGGKSHPALGFHTTVVKRHH